MEKLIGAEIRNLQNSIMRKMDTITQGATNLNISASNVFIIDYLMMNQNNVTFQKDLEKAMSISKSTCSKVLDLMKSKGLINKEAVEDGRYNKIVITPLGEKVYAQIEEEIKKNEDILKQGISEEDINTFLKCISQMEKNME